MSRLHGDRRLRPLNCVFSVLSTVSECVLPCHTVTHHKRVLGSTRNASSLHFKMHLCINKKPAAFTPCCCEQNRQGWHRKKYCEAPKDCKENKQGAPSTGRLLRNMFVLEAPERWNSFGFFGPKNKTSEEQQNGAEQTEHLNQVCLDAERVTFNLLNVCQMLKCQS